MVQWNPTLRTLVNTDTRLLWTVLFVPTTHIFSYISPLNTDTFSCPFGVRINRVPLYISTTLHNTSTLSVADPDLFIRWGPEKFSVTSGLKLRWRPEKYSGLHHFFMLPWTNLLSLCYISSMVFMKGQRPHGNSERKRRTEWRKCEVQRNRKLDQQERRFVLLMCLDFKLIYLPCWTYSS